MSPRTARRSLLASIALWAAALVIVPVLGFIPLAPAVAQGALPNQDTLAATLGSDGHLALNASLGVANGSALRYAMDGNFTPIVNAMPVNASTRAAILGRIEAAEANPVFAPFFGNRDGVVEPDEVALFSYFLGQGSRFIPSGFFSASSIFAVRLDGNPPTGGSLGSVSFTNAAGPDGSNAPLGIDTAVTLTFDYSGSGHALSVRWAGVTVGPAPGSGSLSVTFRTPPGETITGTTGFGSVSVSNDILGWGSAAAHGSASLAQPGNFSVSFGPAFPLGYVLIGAGLAAVVASSTVWVLRRRRRVKAMPHRSAEPEPEARSSPEGSERRSGSE